MKTKNISPRKIIVAKVGDLHICSQNRHLAFAAKAKLSANDLSNHLCKIIYYVWQYNSAIFQPRRQQAWHMKCSKMFCAHCMTL
jgi:hypothetical protein